MKKILPILIIGLFTGLLSCKETTKGNENRNPESDYVEIIKNLSDSINVQGITIKSLFKSQILAHQGLEYDSTMIIEKVYHTN